MHKYSQAEKDEIWNWSLIGSVMSYVGFAFIFVTFICISNLRRRLPFRMLMNLAVMDMMLTLSGLLTVNAEEFNEDYHNLCVFVGFVRNFAANSSILWSLMFAVTMSDYMFKEVRSNVELRNYVVAYGVPLILSVIPLLMDSYGDATIYCWLHNYRNLAVGMDFLFFYLPLIIVMICLFFYYIRMIIRHRRASLTNDDKKLLVQFLFHPFSMMLCFIFPALNRFYNLPMKDGRILWMMKLHVLCTQSLVLVNALVFGMNKTVWSQINQAFRSLSCMRRKPIGTGEPQYYSISSTFIRHSLKESLVETSERKVSLSLKLV